MVTAKTKFPNCRKQNVDGGTETLRRMSTVGWKVSHEWRRWSGGVHSLCFRRSISKIISACRTLSPLLCQQLIWNFFLKGWGRRFFSAVSYLSHIKIVKHNPLFVFSISSIATYQKQLHSIDLLHQIKISGRYFGYRFSIWTNFPQNISFHLMLEYFP